MHNTPSYDLSVLILSLPERLDSFLKLIKEVRRQSINYSVQIIYLGDNQSMLVGEKRNFIKAMVKGTYCCFIDDDDSISDNYISSIIDAMDSNPDVITFEVQKYENGNKRMKQIFNMKSHRQFLKGDHYTLPPNHLCAWKSSLVHSVDFPNKNLSEDHEWSAKMRSEDLTVHSIDEVLYHYYYDTKMSKTHPRP